MLQRALSDERGLPGVSAEPEALDLLARLAEGDARRALSTLEVAATLSNPVTPEAVTEAALDQLRRGTTMMLPTEDSLWVGAELSRRFPPTTRFVADAGNSTAWAIHYLEMRNRRGGTARVRPGERRHDHAVVFIHLRQPESVRDPGVGGGIEIS